MVFVVKKAEIVLLKLVDEFGWHVELDQQYVKSLLDAVAMNIANRLLLLDRRDKRATVRRRNWAQRNTESSDPVLESVST